MQAATIAAGLASVAVWVYLLLGRGWFWRIQEDFHECSAKHTRAKAPIGNAPSVVAVVPARNERETIGRAVKSLLQQKFGGELRVIVVDDQSDDGTAEELAHICQNRAVVGHAKLLVVNGKPLPQGWTGKVWAMQQGREAARAFAPDYLLLTDADVVHAPDSLATLVSIAESGAYDLASFMVRLHCESVAERLLVPAFVFFFFLLYPPSWIADPRKKTAGAAGGCMLVRADALERVGGTEAIRGEVIDDCALARVMKNTPGRAKTGSDRGARPNRGTRQGVWLGLSTKTVSLREYESWRDIGRMIARTAFNQLRHSWGVLAGALVGMAVTFIVPVILVLIYPTLARPGLGWVTQGWG